MCLAYHYTLNDSIDNALNDKYAINDTPFKPYPTRKSQL